MKFIRNLLFFLIVAGILFASTLSANAIGFEAEQAYESVFVIYSGNSLGSGFALGENCIVTNAHVIDDPNGITVKTYSGDMYPAAVLGISDQADIAVLIVPDAHFPYLDIADPSAMKTGDDIYAIGAPRGMAYTLTKGSISARERIIADQAYIQIDAPINQGNSGGPLMNDAGQVLGMNTLKLSDSEGIGLAIPITRICSYLGSLGIPLTSGGNVAEPVVSPENAPASHPTEEAKPSATRDNQQHTPGIAYAAVVIAALSLGANVVLAVLLVNERKKSPSLPYDPRKRTDFDIDILE